PEPVLQSDSLYRPVELKPAIGASLLDFKNSHRNRERLAAGLPPTTAKTKPLGGFHAKVDLPSPYTGSDFWHRGIRAATCSGPRPAAIHAATGSASTVACSTTTSPTATARSDSAYNRFIGIGAAGIRTNLQRYDHEIRRQIRTAG